VVTSATGSVIRDIMNILDRRFYNSYIKIFPVRVQGETAALEISHAISKLNEIAVWMSLSLPEVEALWRNYGRLTRNSGKKHI